MFCPRCGSETDEAARYCTTCGADLPSAVEAGESRRAFPARLAGLIGRSRRERLVTIATLVAILITIGAFVALDTGGDGGSKQGSEATGVEAVGLACVAAKKQIRSAARRAIRDPRAGLEDYAGSLLRAVVDFRAVVRAQPADERLVPLDEALLAVAIDTGALSRAARERSGDLAGLTAELDAATGEAEAAIVRLGLDRCAAISLDPASLG